MFLKITCLGPKFSTLSVLAILICTLCCCQKSRDGVAKHQEIFKVLSYNIYEGFRGDANNIYGFKRWIDTVKPDVIAFQEMKGFSKAKLQHLAEEMGYSYSLMFHETGLPVALISRYPITSIKTSPSNLHLIQAKILDYHFMVIHLSPLTYEKRRQELAVILQRCRAIPATEKILLMGDFNNMSPQDSSFYQNSVKMNLVKQSEVNNPGVKILNNGKIDYSTIQDLIDGDFYDSWKVFRSGYEKSAPSKLRSHGNYTRIDYIWINKTLLEDYIEAYFIKDAFTDYLSDHYPMVLRLKR